MSGIWRFALERSVSFVWALEELACVTKYQGKASMSIWEYQIGIIEC